MTIIKQMYGNPVMNVKGIKPTGMFKAWKSSVFEVTAAREEKENFVDPRQVADLTAKTVKTLIWQQMKISVQKNF